MKSVARLGVGGSIGSGSCSSIALISAGHSWLALAGLTLGTLSACAITIVDRLTMCRVLAATIAVYEAGGDAASVTSSLTGSTAPDG
jgi:hypothetical protein